MWHNPLLSIQRQLRRKLASADDVPGSLQRTTLFAIFEAKAKNQAVVDECHLLLGALRDLGGRRSRFPINIAATRNQLGNGPEHVEGPYELSPKARNVLARCRNAENVVEQLQAEKWVRA